MYRITKALSVGPFASPERAKDLLAAGVTHVLNVSDGPSAVGVGEGSFLGVNWVPMSDSRRLPRATAVRALDALHELASVPGSHVYVHCVAGLVRSPTILWLYLIALGVPPKDARTWIEGRVPNANAGSIRMVDHEHVVLAQMHGLMHFFPHPRPDLVVPFETAGEGS
jgi:hypothetical protein